MTPHPNTETSSARPSEAPMQTALWTLLAAVIASSAFELSVLLVPGVQENPHLFVRLLALAVVVQPGAARLKSRLPWLIVSLMLALAGFQLVHLAFTGAPALVWAAWVVALASAAFWGWWMGPRPRPEAVDGPVA